MIRLIFKSEKKRLQAELETTKQLLESAGGKVKYWASEASRLSTVHATEIQKLNYKIELLETVLKQLHIPVKLKDK